MTGLITNATHAAFARVTDECKPHCHSLMEMGLGGLESVNKLVQLVSIRLNLPFMTSENSLCKRYRVAEIFEFVLQGQSFYKLEMNRISGRWMILKRRWGESRWNGIWLDEDVAVVEV